MQNLSSVGIYFTQSIADSNQRSTVNTARYSHDFMQLHIDQHVEWTARITPKFWTSVDQRRWKLCVHTSHLNLVTVPGYPCCVLKHDQKYRVCTQTEWSKTSVRHIVLDRDNQSESNARMHVRKPFRIDSVPLHIDDKYIQKGNRMYTSTLEYLGTLKRRPYWAGFWRKSENICREF